MKINISILILFVILFFGCSGSSGNLEGKYEYESLNIIEIPENEIEEVQEVAKDFRLDITKTDSDYTFTFSHAQMGEIETTTLPENAENTYAYTSMELDSQITITQTGSNITSKFEVDTGSDKMIFEMIFKKTE